MTRMRYKFTNFICSALCDDGFGDPVEIEARNPLAAARKYVDDENRYVRDL